MATVNSGPGRYVLDQHGLGVALEQEAGALPQRRGVAHRLLANTALSGSLGDG